MGKDTNTNYKDIQALVLKIFQGGDFIAKVLLIMGLFATGVALVFLIIKALWWLIIFSAGVVLLHTAMRKAS